MRRRSFIAVAANAISLVRAAKAAPTTDAWSLVHRQTQYRIALNGPALTCDCFGPDAAPARVESSPPDNASLVTAGHAHHPVSWRVDAWRQPDARTLAISLAATGLPLLAEVGFAIDEPSGMLRRRTTLRHSGDGPDIPISATLSGWFGVHEPIDHVIYLAGSWAAETETQRERLFHSPILLESRVGKTGFGAQPHVVLRAAAASYVCQIFWSGNWVLQVVPSAGGAAVLGGLNNWEFHDRLLPGASLALPTALFGRVDGDLNQATQRLHDYRRSIRPNPDRVIPVQFNSWYPYSGNPTAAAMLALIPGARRLGCEVFVIDAGWYRTDDGEAAEDWQVGTGDWRTSRNRFPNGLREISNRCRADGLRFGLWFEPEVIGQQSRLRRTHPEWLHWIDGRPTPAGERAVLNLGVPAARAHALARISRMVDIVGVDWVKWDFNADLGAGGWAPDLPADLTAEDPLVAHYRGLYALQDDIRQRFPDLVLEMCASGGGRMDGEILSHAHVNWMSDQTSSLRKLAIHFGSQLAHPAVDCNDWLIEWPPGNIPGYNSDDAPEVAALGDLPFRLRVAMLGSFGISARIDSWSEADMATAAAHVAAYTDWVRPLIHHGDQYLLTKGPPPGPGGDWAAIWYAAKDGQSGALFAFRLDSRDNSRAFGLPGLLAKQRYRVSNALGVLTVATGAALGSGLRITIPGKYRSDLLRVDTA